MTTYTTAPRVLADAVPKSWYRGITLVLGGAGLVGLCAQVSIPLPFTPVPLTLQTFAVLLVPAVLGTVRGVGALGLYALAGSLGVPWFAHGSSGFGGATYGYIVGFLMAALVVGRLAEHGATRSWRAMTGVMILGNLIIYGFGVSWLKLALSLAWGTALSLGMTPFVAGDLIKLAAAAGLLPLTWRVLRQADLID